MQKLSVFSSVRVIGKAVENTACGKRKCYEKGGDVNAGRECCDKESMGFVGYPYRLRTQEVQVCHGGVKCTKKGYNRKDFHDTDGNCCGNDKCGPGLLGVSFNVICNTFF